MIIYIPFKNDAMTRIIINLNSGFFMECKFHERNIPSITFIDHKSYSQSKCGE